MADKIIDLGNRVKIRLEENKYSDYPKYIAHIYTGGNKAIASQPVYDEAQAVKWAKAYTNSTPYSNGRQKAETYLNQRMKDAGVKVENDGSTSYRDYKVGDELKLRGRYGVIKRLSPHLVTLDIDGELYTAPWNDPQLKR